MRNPDFSAALRLPQQQQQQKKHVRQDRRRRHASVGKCLSPRTLFRHAARLRGAACIVKGLRLWAMARAVHAHVRQSASEPIHG